MREIFMVLPLFLAISTAPMCFGQGKTPSHTLTINVVKGAVKTGTKIRLTIALRNTSTHEITVAAVPMGDHKDHPEVEGFRPVVLDANGKRPALTKWGKQIFGPLDPDQGPLALNAVGTWSLAPGEVYTSEIVLSDLYDLSVPGTYSVQVPDYDDDLQQAVKSNAATITVVP